MSAFILTKKIEAYFLSYTFSQTTILKAKHIYFEFVGCQWDTDSSE